MVEQLEEDAVGARRDRVISADALEFDANLLRKTFGAFPSGVTAVCGLVDGEPVGMAASSFTSVSLDPPMVLVCVATTSSTWQRLRGAPRLGVSVLGAEHALACRQLASKEGERFAGVDWTATDTGAVMISGVPAWLECVVVDEIPAGDHWVVLLRIEALDFVEDVAPLVFHASKFHQIHIA